MLKTAPVPRRDTPLTTLEALDDGRLSDRWTGWAVTLGITVMAFLLRLVNLGHPHAVMFDETYYAKDAYGLLQSGYERQWPDTDPPHINKDVLAGDFSGMATDPSYVVHPPLGKWMIAIGEWMFGMNPFGWRFMACVFGAMLVFFTIRLARRVSRSTLVGGIAGLLLTFDGLAFVMSRIALLDIFQATFAVAAVSALVADRDYFRRQLANHLRKRDLTDLGGSFGPVLLWRPWRIMAGILFGASCAVKWNTLYMIAVFGIVTVIWDLGARRLAGAGSKMWWSVLADGVPAFVHLVVVAVPVYIASWFGWLTTTGGYYRKWGYENPNDLVVQIFGPALGSLWHYHKEAYGFHTGEHMMQNTTHPYEGHPGGWLVMARPIAVYAQNGIKPGVDGCYAEVGSKDTCVRIITAMGTPVLWWFCAVALVAALWLWIAKRDWRFAVPVLALMSVWLPWFQYADRPLYFFYAIMIVPFYVTILAMVLGKLLGPADGPNRRERSMVVGVVIFLVILNFAFLYPALTGELMLDREWRLRMWFPTWI